MDHETFVEQLQNPKTYGLDDDKKITLLQTHISFVVLTDSFAYKVKKPVDFGFLDFSTLEKRKHFCEEELRLNSRLCPQIYENVIQFTKKDEGNGIEINGNGKTIEYAVKMKKFSQDHIMTQLLKEEQISKNHIDDLVDTLVLFYKDSPSSEKIRSFGSIESVKQNIDENFEQTENKIGITISQETFDFIKIANDLFFKEKKDVLVKRKNEGFIKSCHGDLHSGNIVLIEDSLCVFDCIEFNKRFRYIDVASDIGFFAMDLDIREKPYLSSYLIREYVEKSGDTSLLSVLNLYKSYRAYVRAKVLGFQIDDPHISPKKKQDLIEEISNYFELSKYYAHLMKIQTIHTKPFVFMMSGLTGTGKSTLAEKIAIDYEGKVINSDMIRKKDAGIHKYEKHLDDPNKGLYSPEKVHQTYEQVLSKAKEEINAGNNVVLDATFQKYDHRMMAKKLAEETNSIFIPIYCTCPEATAKKWLDERMKSKSVSDGRWEIYQIQKDSFDMFTDDEKPIIINTAEKKFKDQLMMFSSIIDKIHRESL